MNFFNFATESGKNRIISHRGTFDDPSETKNANPAWRNMILEHHFNHRVQVLVAPPTIDEDSDTTATSEMRQAMLGRISREMRKWASDSKVYVYEGPLSPFLSVDTIREYMLNGAFYALSHSTQLDHTNTVAIYNGRLHLVVDRETYLRIGLPSNVQALGRTRKTTHGRSRAHEQQDRYDIVIDLRKLVNEQENVKKLNSEGKSLPGSAASGGETPKKQVNVTEKLARIQWCLSPERIGSVRMVLVSFDADYQAQSLNPALFKASGSKLLQLPSPVLVDTNHAGLRTPTLAKLREACETVAEYMAKRAADSTKAQRTGGVARQKSSGLASIYFSTKAQRSRSGLNAAGDDDDDGDEDDALNCIATDEYACGNENAGSDEEDEENEEEISNDEDIKSTASAQREAPLHDGFKQDALDALNWLGLVHAGFTDVLKALDQEYETRVGRELGEIMLVDQTVGSKKNSGSDDAKEEKDRFLASLQQLSLDQPQHQSKPALGLSSFKIEKAGFIAPEQIIQIVDIAREALRTRASSGLIASWICITAWGYRNCPAAWKDYLHGRGSSVGGCDGANNLTIFIFAGGAYAVFATVDGTSDYM